MIVQIYEIQTPEEAEALISMGVDHIGSVLAAEEAWRDPMVKKTADVVRGRAGHSIIPLFHTPETVFRVLDYYRPDMVHFCESLYDGIRISDGCERLIRLQISIRTRYPEIDIMRSIPVAPPGRGEAVPSLELAAMFAPVSDYFLMDTLMLKASPSSITAEADLQPVEGFVGITGKTCDWDTAKTLVEASPIPVILAGGLSPENVREAIIAVHPSGVDSCTNTNALDAAGKPVRFRKDMERVRRFVAEARHAETSPAAGSIF